MYNNGYVQHNPKIFVTYWHWTGDPSGEAHYLESFLNGIGASSWLNTDSQYYDKWNGDILNAPNQFIQSYYDGTSIPDHPSQSDIAGKAFDASQHFGFYYDAAYIIALPPGHDPPGFNQPGPGGFCAYHSDLLVGAHYVAYVALPYMTDAGTGHCGENAVNPGSAGLLDGVSIVGGHEVAETQTDPVPYQGWADSTEQEIGDKCAWIDLQNVTLITGTFAVQPLWSNSNNNGGCALALDKANDLSLGPDGSVWFLGTASLINGNPIYEYLSNGSYTVDQGAVDISRAPDNNLWFVETQGNPGYYNVITGTRTIFFTPPGFTGISVGAGGAVWLIANDSVNGGHSIYEYTNQTFTKVAGGAIDVAVAPDGTPWVVNSYGTIFKRVNGSWQAIPTGLASDIAAGGDGSIWIIGTDNVPGGHGIYKYNGSGWTKYPGGAVDISVDPNGVPWVANNVQQIFRYNSISGSWDPIY